MGTRDDASAGAPGAGPDPVPGPDVERARSAELAPSRFVDAPESRLARWLILAALLLVPQFVVFGPSLVGKRILLPLDLLQQRGIYMPVPAGPEVVPQDLKLADLVYELELERVYAVSAVRAGRIPLWNPLIYCGTPFVAANHTSVFYPLRVLDYVFPGPVTIAWVQLVKSLLAGLGAYAFARRVMRASFLASALGAALWPWTGFLVLWAGFTISQVAAHLPWILLASDECLRKPRSLWPAAVALVTAVLLVSGHASIAAHVLIAAGLYVSFRIVDLHGVRGVIAKPALVALTTWAAGIGVGVLLSGPQTLPTLEYMQESWRIQKRQEGRVETPPLGAAALPAVVMPYVYGSTQSNTVLVVGGNRLEGPEAAYAGLLGLLLLAPLGFANRRLRRFQFFWLALGFLGLVQVLGVPLLESIFELPVLDTLRNNRFTLVTAWAGVAMAVAGLDGLLRGEIRWSRWFWCPIAVVAGLGAWNVLQIGAAPEVLTRANEALRAGARGRPPLDSIEHVELARQWFARMHLAYAGLCALALVSWFVVRAKIAGARPVSISFRGTALVLGLAALAELTVHAYDVNPQCRPRLYYPRVSMYEALAASPAGRVCGGLGTLPASLNVSLGLPDVRGYDAADPARIIELLGCFTNDRSPPAAEYAAVQWWVPKLPSPLADLLSLRYLISFGREPAAHILGEGGFWVQENTTALPRAFVPARAEVVDDKARRLASLSTKDFDPRRVVYLESPSPGGPDLSGALDPIVLDEAPASGVATFEVDEPERVVLALDMRSAGWLVLSDRWAPGWRAWVDGAERPVRIADHALRAVHVETGSKRLEFRYEPVGWRRGLVCAGVAIVLLALGCAWSVRRGRTLARGGA